MQLNTDLVFTGLSGLLGAAWQCLAAAENELGAKLLAVPPDTVVIAGDSAWHLAPRDGRMVLFHSKFIKGALLEPTSRFEFELDVMDFEEDVLLEAARSVRATADAFETLRKMPLAEFGELDYDW